MTKRKKLSAAVAGVSLFLVAAAAWAQTRTIAPGKPTWSYLCFEGDGAAEVMKKANQAGAQGWQMVAASPTARGAVWCFQQPRWARPEPQE